MFCCQWCPIWIQLIDAGKSIHQVALFFFVRTMSCIGQLITLVRKYLIYIIFFFRYRLNIKNAQTLIHYYFPRSKNDFNVRFSFALDRLKPIELEDERPVSHLLITEEFKNALLTIVRLMPRFGHVVSEDLKKEAMLSYCDIEFSKTQLPLCIELKVYVLIFRTNVKFKFKPFFI